MLSGLKDDDIERLYPRAQLHQITKKTISTFEMLMADLRNIRDRGWSIDDEENELGTNCVGAPIFDYRDKVIAAVSVAWDFNANPDLTREGFAPQVVRCAALISLKMGCTQSRIRQLVNSK